MRIRSINKEDSAAYVTYRLQIFNLYSLRVDDVLAILFTLMFNQGRTTASTQISSDCRYTV